MNRCAKYVLNSIQGPACIALMENLDLMLTIPEADQHKDLLRLCHAVLAFFHEIVSKIFSNSLADNWQSLIEDLKEKYLATGISVTTKVKNGNINKFKARV